MQDQTNTTDQGTRDDGFDGFALARPLRENLRRAGYRTPTPIQQAAIPKVLDGNDLIGCAQTGTGKTAAFALPILQRLLGNKQEGRPYIHTLVLAPTRELAAQIEDSFSTFARGTRLRSTVVFGGVKKGPQVRALAKPPAILVATPGRLLDLLADKALSLSQVEVVVLDEADRMLDMGFIHDVRKILGALPSKRQTLLFSATMPTEVANLSKQFLDRPQRVAVDPISSPRGPIEQRVHFVEKKQKTELLVSLLSAAGNEQTLVFTRTKHGANKVVRQLERAGIGAAAIHGNKSQSARESALAAFKRGTIRVVVATDLASRGLDIKQLPLVINYDLPNEPEVYVHRIGRTGRAGETGTALSFCASDEQPYLRSIEKLTKKSIDRVGRAPRAHAEATAQAATSPAPATRRSRPRPAEHSPAESRRPRSRRRRRSRAGGNHATPRGGKPASGRAKSRGAAAARG